MRGGLVRPRSAEHLLGFSARRARLVTLSDTGAALRRPVRNPSLGYITAMSGHGGRRKRPSFSALVSNWNDYDAPVYMKAWMAQANFWRKVFTLSNCCGNEGEPGC
jgi:hypothetical protein